MNVHKKLANQNIFPPKLSKMNADTFANFTSLHFNDTIDIDEFPQVFKHTDITPVHKKKEKSDKTYYRPVSILPKLYKIYEKLIYIQPYDYFDKILFPRKYVDSTKDIVLSIAY